MARPDAVDAIRAAAVPLGRGPRDHDALLDLVGDARFVLLGEATHGSHAFYAERARITRRLIEEKGCQAVAVEADWPDACRVNRHVRQSHYFTARLAAQCDALIHIDRTSAVTPLDPGGGRHSVEAPETYPAGL